MSQDLEDVGVQVKSGVLPRAEGHAEEARLRGAVHAIPASRTEAKEGADPEGEQTTAERTSEEIPAR